MRSNPPIIYKTSEDDEEEASNKKLIDYFVLFGATTMKNSDRTRMLSDLAKKFSENNSSHPASSKIIALIQTTIKFMNQTNPDFSKKRETLKDNVLLQRLNEIATELKSTLNDLKTMKLSTEEQATVSHAIQFCEESLTLRLGDLSKEDKICIAYQSSESELKKLLESEKIVTKPGSANS